MTNQEFENMKENMLWLFTSQWYDGILEQGHGRYLSNQSLKRDINNFDYYGGCWNDVIIKKGSTVIFEWRRNKDIKFNEDINTLKEKLTQFINQL